jgi:hypothetical protein
LDNSEEMSRKKDIMMESVKKEKDSLTKEI